VKIVVNKYSHQPRKVLHVLNSASGGAALSTIDLIKATKKEGVGACAVCHDVGTSEERERLREATLGEVLFTPLYWWNKKIRADHWKRSLLEAHQILRTGWAHYSALNVARFAISSQADLIHTNTILTPEGGMAARSLGLPHVWHLRELIGPGQPFRLSMEGPALGSYLSAHCSKLIANSRTSAKYISAWLPSGLLDVVPNGIDFSQFPGRAEHPPGEPTVVAMVGSLNSRTKKHALFIEAASKINTKLGVEFRVYGHNPQKGDRSNTDGYVEGLHDLVRRNGLGSRFKWMGHFSDPARIMSEIDILVHPADNESFGRVVVEAMAAGLPVVGVRGGGVQEIVQDGISGFLSKPDDPVELAMHVERLVTDPPLRATLGENGRQRAMSEYSLESCSAGVLRVYRVAMERPLIRTRLSRRPTLERTAEG
jgi:glycosyltransferase involved in cell wall biosynthesis